MASGGTDSTVKDTPTSEERPGGATQIWLDGGSFAMGSDRHYPDEAPVRTATVDGFWIDRSPVTNDQFARFVDDTGYVTLAEKVPDASLYPGAVQEELFAASMVFVPTPGPVDLRDHYQWWAFIPGACWNHPLGVESGLDGLADHPVVHVAYEDALAYAAWAGCELPIEAEWEYAARGGLDGAEFTWGEGDPQDGPSPKANTWQGRFPYQNTRLDGWARTSPVGSYEPNGYGLVDMCGNVWEWTADPFDVATASSAAAPCCSGDQSATPEIPRQVVKGGSHLCTTQYCFRYRPAARQPLPVDTGMSHTGFRCIRRTAPPPGAG